MLFWRQLILALFLLGTFSDSVWADRYGRPGDFDRRYDRDKGREENRDRLRDAGREGRKRQISLDAAVQMVQRRYNARVVRAETHFDGGRTIYRLRLLNQDGRVWTVTVDADSGAMY